MLPIVPIKSQAAAVSRKPRLQVIALGNTAEKLIPLPAQPRQEVRDGLKTVQASKKQTGAEYLCEAADSCLAAQCELVLIYIEIPVPADI